ncbi:hypothetical protein R3P38DRAFT_2770262 [Favolaschia claudopus]|uniref:Uncharacterized protein n=1 Tax=Favolaschia claudopus TaxID=2862362 RepID=A0AAW0CCL0_9AGAR
MTVTAFSTYFKVVSGKLRAKNFSVTWSIMRTDFNKMEFASTDDYNGMVEAATEKAKPTVKLELIEKGDEPEEEGAGTENEGLASKKHKLTDEEHKMAVSRPVPFPGLLRTFPRSPIPLQHWTYLPVHPVDPSDTRLCIPICFRPIRPSCPRLLTWTPTSRSILLHYTTPSSPHRSFCSTMEPSRTSSLDLDFTFAFSMPFRPMAHFPMEPSDSEECPPEFLTVPSTSSDFRTVCRSPNPIGIQVDSAPIALLLSIPLPLCSPCFAHVLD